MCRLILNESIIGATLQHRWKPLCPYDRYAERSRCFTLRILIAFRRNRNKVISSSNCFFLLIHLCWGHTTCDSCYGYYYSSLLGLYAHRLFSADSFRWRLGIKNCAWWGNHRWHDLSNPQHASNSRIMVGLFERLTKRQTFPCCCSHLF